MLVQIQKPLLSKFFIDKHIMNISTLHHMPFFLLFSKNLIFKMCAGLKHPGQNFRITKRDLDQHMLC